MQPPRNVPPHSSSCNLLVHSAASIVQRHLPQACSLPANHRGNYGCGRQGTLYRGPEAFGLGQCRLCVRSVCPRGPSGAPGLGNPGGPSHGGTCPGTFGRGGEIRPPVPAPESQGGRRPLALGSAATQRRDFGRALRHIHEATKLAPEYAVGWLNLGIVRRCQADLEGATKAFEKALSFRDIPLVRWNLAQVQLLCGTLSAGWENFESRLQAKPSRYFGFSAPLPQLWMGEPLAGKRLMLRWEQGLGDTIQMLRYIPHLVALGAHVILDCQKPLQDLVASMPGLSAVEATVRDGVPTIPADYWLPLMSLPHRLSERLEKKHRRLSAGPIRKLSLASRICRIAPSDHRPAMARLGVPCPGRRTLDPHGEVHRPLPGVHRNAGVDTA